MDKLRTLPLPDWGLRCPHCQTALAGLYDYRCDVCLRPFDLVSVLAAHRPILDLGLTCPKCKYALTGLTGDRCPECGSVFNLPTLIKKLYFLKPPPLLSTSDATDHHVVRRAPHFTGRERPLPDFLLYCRACTRPLAGAEANACPFCGASFDPNGYVAPGEEVNISPHIPPYLIPTARMILYEAQVPYLAKGEQIWGEITDLRVLVPRAYVLDALHALADAMPTRRAGAADWRCPTCGESVPGDFDLCWNCGGQHSEESTASEPTEPEEPPSRNLGCPG